MSTPLKADITDQLLQEVYNIVNCTENLNDHRAKLEQQLKKVIDLRWEDSNIFESYFQEFSSVIEAMYQQDFTKRLKENDDKDSFLNLIAHSLNIVNEKLEQKFASPKMIDLTIDSLELTNRIVLISVDGTSIFHAHSSLDFDSERLIRSKINAFIDEENLEMIRSKRINSLSYNGEINHPLFIDLDTKGSTIHIEMNKEQSIVVTITLYPENKIIPQIPRIVKLISLIKDHFDNHPEKVLSIFGNIYTMEFLSLYAELKKYSDFKGYTPNS